MIVAPTWGCSCTMKRYLVFTFYAGRPLGGFRDFLDGFDSVEEALENLHKERTRFFQIVDGYTHEVVKEGLTWFKDFSPEQFEKAG